MKKVTNEFRVRPEDKARALDLYTRLSSEYDEKVSQGFFLKWFRTRERNAVEGFLKLDGTARSFLDVGCGAGIWSRHAKRAGLYVKAVDASPGMVKNVASYVDEAAVADVDNLSCSQTFDRVLCAGVLDFVLDPKKSFENLCRCVAPGGRLIILAPRVGIFGTYYRWEKWWFGISVNLYTLEWVVSEAKRHGLVLADYRRPLPTNMAIALDRTT